MLFSKYLSASKQANNKIYINKNHIYIYKKIKDKKKKKIFIFFSLYHGRH